MAKIFLLIMIVYSSLFVATTTRADNALALDDHLYKADVLTELEQYDAALTEYDAAILANPDNADAYIYKCILLNSLGRHEDALKTISLLEEKEPGNYLAYNNKGATLIFLGNYDEAIEQLNKSLSLDDECDCTRVNLALAMLKKGDAKSAMPILNLLVNNTDDEIRVRALSMLGRKDEMLTLVTKLSNNNHKKRVFKTDLEFEPYWADPDFIAIVGSD